MKAINFSITLLIIAALTGCATSGNKPLEKHTETTISKLIVEGKTTKSQITSFFGIANNVTFTDSGEVWTYKFERAVPHATNFIPFFRLISSGADVSVKELVIMFDQNAVVSRYTMREITREVKTGIAH